MTTPAESGANGYAREYYNDLLRELPEEYTKYRWFSSKAAELDYRETRRAILRALAYLPAHAARLLEVGCGDGTWTELFAHRAGELHCIEQSEEMLARAKKRLSGLANVDYERADFMASAPREAFDAAVSVRVFEYFGDKDAAAAQFARFLAPGGTLILVTKNASRYRKDVASGSQRLHAIEIDRREMEAVLHGAGFDVMKVYPAILKWRPEHALARAACDALHAACTWASAFARVTDPFPRLAESYVYIAVRNTRTG